jgi:hypothetical protein
MVEKYMNFSCVFSIDVDESHYFMEALNGEESQHLKRPWILIFTFYKIIRHRYLIIPLPLGCKPMNCKWIFKIKYNVNGFGARHKACLVAKGFSQIECIYFNEIFSLVV